MIRYLLLLITLLCVIGQPCEAQQKKKVKTTPFSGIVVEEPEETNQCEGVPAVVVELIVPGDTLRAITNVNGQFYFKRVPLGKAHISLSHVAYETLTDEVNVRSNFASGFYKMKPKTVELNDLVVKGKVPPFTLHGDTVVFHAAAFKTLMGDEVMKIVEQLPGVQIDASGQIKVFGKSLSRTYVDGKLIFGNNVNNALENLSADDVISIKSYDQVSAKNRLDGNYAAEKERVFDIETKSKLTKAVVGHALASYGKNIEDSHDRYAVGATANLFSEAMLLNGNAFVNNINRESNMISDILNVGRSTNPDSRDVYAGLGMERHLGDVEVGPQYALSYSYDDTRNRNWDYSTRQYEPNESYTERIYNDSSYTVSRSHSHVIKASYEDYMHHSFRVSTDLSFTNSDDYSLNNARTLTDGLEDYTSTAQQSDRKSYSWSAGLARELFQYKALRLNANANFQLSENDGDGLRLDSVLSTASNRVYQTDLGGYQRNFVVGVNMAVNFLQPRKRKQAVEDDEEPQLEDRIAHSINVNFNYRRIDERKKELRMEADGTMMRLDSVSSQNYPRNYHTLSMDAGYYISLGKLNFSVGVDCQYATRAEDRVLYRQSDNNYHFLFFDPSLTVRYGGFSSGISFTYNGRTQLPSMEQLSEQINDTNLLFVSSGNSKLKPSCAHDFQIYGNLTFADASALSYGTSVTLNHNNIASRTHYYGQGALLTNLGGYQLTNGATYNTYENFNGDMSVSANVGYQRALDFIKSNLSSYVFYNFDRSVSFVQEQKTHNYNQKVSLSLNLRSNFSRRYRIDLVSYTSLSYAKSTIGSDRNYFSQQLIVSSENNLTKRLFLNARFGYDVVHPFSDGLTGNREVNLNAIVGYRFLKNRASISLAGYDLLNKSMSFTNSVAMDYVLSSWRPVFGRYWTVNFSYKFNSTGKGSSDSRFNLNQGEKSRGSGSFVTIGM